MSKGSELATESSDEGKNNLSLWRSVEKTEPAMTKRVAYGKRSYTTVDPQYQLRKATSLWGPYGHRWGLRNIQYEIKELRYNEKVILQTLNADKKVVQSTEQMADYVKYSIILRAEFFYPTDSGGEAFFEIVNDDKFEVGDDALKKIITNTRSKALSYLGFAADVFMGKFDDTKYVEQQRGRYAKQNEFLAKAEAWILDAKTIADLEEAEVKLDRVETDQAKQVDKLAIEELRELIEERRQLLS